MENSSSSTYKRDSISDDYPADRIKNLISLAFSSLRNSSSGRSQKGSCLTASLSSTLPAVRSRVMPVEEAEALVRQWQAVKADALGPNHQVHLLTDVLDDSMLHQWEGLADAAYDNLGPERAGVEVLLEEAAELVGESQEKNPNYYSTYKISYALRKQNDGSWKFIKADVEAPP
ncbi:Plastid division protein CDP1, chloroplastic-like protein [Drosera capensis]